MHNKLKYINGKDIDTETERNTTDNVSVYDELMKWAIETSKAKKSESPQFNALTMTTFVNAIIYEPTNQLRTDESSVNHRTYMHDTPKQLLKYLEEFKSKDTIIEKGPDMLECKGACSNSSHKFIAAVTNYICPVCKDNV